MDVRMTKNKIRTLAASAAGRRGRAVDAGDQQVGFSAGAGRVGGDAHRRTRRRRRGGCRRLREGPPPHRPVTRLAGAGVTSVPRVVACLRAGLPRQVFLTATATARDVEAAL